LSKKPCSETLKPLVYRPKTVVFELF
jgi:hypothetical protein